MQNSSNSLYTKTLNVFKLIKSYLFAGKAKRVRVSEILDEKLASEELEHWLVLTKAYDNLHKGFERYEPHPDFIIRAMLEAGHRMSAIEQESLRDRHVALHGDAFVTF